MAKKDFKYQDIINGRISLLFFMLLALAGLLWAERFARYRYDYIFRQMLPWLLPVLFGISAAAFGLLLFLWLKNGRKKGNRLFSLSFVLCLLAPFPAAFLFPWLTLFANGLQFFRLATELVLYAAVGYFTGYVGYYKAGPAAAPAAGLITLNILCLYYYYERCLSPSTFILNTAEFGYLPNWALALICAGIMAAGTLFALLLNRRCSAPAGAVCLIAPSAFSLILIGVGSIPALPILAVRILIFGGIGLLAVWYLLWCLLRKGKIL